MSDQAKSSSRRSPVSLGDRIDQYELLDVLTSGPVTTAYRAHDHALDRLVAVHVLAAELAQQPEVARRFLQYARTAALLQHPNLIHLYAAGEPAPGLAYFVTELVNGETLATRLDHQGRLPARAAAEFIRQAARGLHGALEHGLVHGGLRPEHLLVAETGSLRVTDFALANEFRTDAASEYLSPEVRAGDAPDHRSDIYALGVLLNRMLTGQLPAQPTPPGPPQTPAALAQILHRMLAKTPATRYQSYPELLRALDHFLAEPPLAERPRPARPLGRVPDRPAPAAPAPPPPAPHSVAKVVLSLVLMVLSVSLATYFVYHSRRTATPTAPATTNATPPVAVKPPAPPAPGPAEQLWRNAQMQIEKLRATNDFAGALAVCDRLQSVCEPFPDLKGQLTQTRQDLQTQERTAAAQENARRAAAQAAAETARQVATQRAAEQAAADRARQATRADWTLKANAAVLAGQWDQGLQDARRVGAEAGADPGLQDAAARYQATFDALLALRVATAARFQANPSPTVTLAAKRGDLTGQLVGCAADHVTLRQTAGNFGFAENAVRWSELTPAGLARVFATGLDAGKPAEAVGYAVLLLEQGAVAQARLDDVRKAVRTALDRHPGPGTMLLFRDVEARLADAARLEDQAAARRRAETEAQNLWTQVHQTLSQNAWLKAGELLGQFTDAYSGTEFGKSRADESKRLATLIFERTKPKDFAPLDISNGCNASFLTANGKPGFYSEEGLHAPRQSPTVPLVGMKPGGLFQLRFGEAHDAIGLTRPESRLPTAVTCKLPEIQRGRYARIAVLSAASVGEAQLQVQFDYDAGDPQTAKLEIQNYLIRTTDQAQGQPAFEMLHPRNPAVTERLYQDVVDLDPKRRLIGLRFKWLSTGTDHPAHCVGIFAISAISAQ